MDISKFNVKFDHNHVMCFIDHPELVNYVKERLPNIKVTSSPKPYVNMHGVNVGGENRTVVASPFFYLDETKKVTNQVKLTKFSDAIEELVQDCINENLSEVTLLEIVYRPERNEELKAIGKYRFSYNFSK